MRNTSKMTTLENKFPLLAVEHGCIISKDADITVAFEVELPELYTVTGAEYEAIHGCWCKATTVSYTHLRNGGINGSACVCMNGNTLPPPDRCITK